MNRCFFRPLAQALCVVCLCAAAPAWSGPAPAQALFATLRVTLPPEVLLDGQLEKLAPGARIWNAQDMMVMSGALQGLNVPVRYVRDMHGLISEVWITPLP